MSASNTSRPVIGIDVTSAVTQGGGIGRYTRELIRSVVRTADQNDYILFSAKQPSKLPVPDPIPNGPNIRYRQAPLSDRWLYRLWYRLRAPVPIQLITGKIDLFHSPDFVLPAIGGDIPTLLTVHDLSFVHFPDTFTPALVNFLNDIVPRSVDRATHILADSQATKKDLISNWDVQEKKITVLYSGVGRNFRPVTEKDKLRAVREKYGLGDDPYMLSVGTLQPRKNFQMLFEAFEIVARDFEHNLFIAGGKGWLYEQILIDVKNRGLENRVRLLGFVDDSDLPALYSGATLFLFPSIYEGFGLPLVEAMACGVPVITSNASSLPEVAGEAAIQLSPDHPETWTHAMMELLRDPGSRTTLVAAGFLQARAFTWTRASGQLAKIYEQLLQN